MFNKRSKIIITAVLFVFLLPGIALCLVKGNQFSIAAKYADSDQIPVVMFDPETSAALGYIMDADIDGKPGDELIIPYRIRITEKEKEDKALTIDQYLTVDVIRNGKKIRGVLKVEISYIRAPRPHITVRKIFRKETAKIFLMVYDGIGIERGPDRKHTLVYNGFHKNDRKRKQPEFETVRMPWKFILYQFSRNVATITEFHSNLKHSAGQFYIRTVDPEAKWPKIPMKKIKKFEAIVKKYQPHVYWEYDY